MCPALLFSSRVLRLAVQKPHDMMITTVTDYMQTGAGYPSGRHRHTQTLALGGVGSSG